jgi:hypothetical protein
MDNTNKQQVGSNEFYRQAIVTKQALEFINRERGVSEDNFHILICGSNDPGVYQAITTVSFPPVVELSENLEAPMNFITAGEWLPLTLNNTPVLNTYTGNITIIQPQISLAEQVHKLVTDTYEELNARRKATVERSARLAKYDELDDEE